MWGEWGKLILIPIARKGGVARSLDIYPSGEIQAIIEKAESKVDISCSSKQNGGNASGKCSIAVRRLNLVMINTRILTTRYISMGF